MSAGSTVDKLKENLAMAKRVREIALHNLTHAREEADKATAAHSAAQDALIAAQDKTL